MRAVDKFYRRIQSVNKQIPHIDLMVEATNIALHAALIRVKFYLQVLKSHFNGTKMKLFLATLFLFLEIKLFCLFFIRMSH